MRVFQARSISQLVFIGFLVVLLPVMGALFYGARSLTQAAREQSENLEIVADRAELVQKMAKSLGDLERLARQYKVLSDPSLLQAFQSEAQTFGHGLDQMRQFYDNSASGPTLLAMDKALEKLNGVFSTEPVKERQALEAIKILKFLDEHMELLHESLERDLKSRVVAARSAAQTTRMRLVTMAALVVPSTILLVILFSLLITRPIKAIDGNIKKIGAGDYATSPVKGPRDLQIVAQRLNWLGERLQASEAAQERFLRHISHELKTPLATIKEGIELLADGIPGPLNERQNEVLSILVGGIQHFQVLINNLLDFNLLRGNKSLHREKVELGGLIHGIVRMHQLTAQRKGAAFVMDGDALHLSIDRAVMSAAIDNLVSNALHFSPDGGQIQLRWQRGAEGVRITVRDEGPGIAKDERDKVFLPFYQGKASRHGPLKGTGLGLSVAKECVELHRGKLQILDAAKGAKLEILLPTQVVLA